MEIARNSKAFKIRRFLNERLEDRIRTSNNRVTLFLRARLGQPHVTLGKVSVIVPIYNVERYLEECLESIRVQNYPDLEVLMINDGSTDSSPRIAKAFARRDRRFKLITKQNAGLGAARNTGVQLATGKYLTFVDSDDAIPYDAYRNMVTALAESGSDFAVGGVERWRAKSRWRDGWAARVHARDQLGITLDDLPEVTKDVFAWNKLFRADFFRETVRGFPEGILYEDQEPTARAFVSCRKFDVLGATTYFWRIREDGTSITQNKLSIRDLNDRIQVAQNVGEIYRESASDHVYRYWLEKTAGEDFAHYYKLSHRASDEYWSKLVDLTRFLFSTLNRENWANVHVKVRTLAYLLSTGDKESVSRMIGAQAQYPRGVPASRGTDGYYVDSGLWDIGSVDFPEFVAELSEKDTALRTGFFRVEWLSTGELEVEGYVYIDNLRAAIDESTLRITAVVGETTEVLLDVERFTIPDDSSALPRSSYTEHPEAGVKFRIPGIDLLDAGEWLTLKVSLEAAMVTREGVFSPQNSENELHLAPFSFAHGEMLLARANQLDGLSVERLQPRVAVTSFEIGDDRTVRFELRTLDQAPSARVYALNRGTALDVSQECVFENGEGAAEVELRLPALPSSSALSTRWELLCELDGEVFPVPYPSGLLSDLQVQARGALALRFGEVGALELADSVWSMTVAEVTGSADGLRISGYYESAVPELPKLALARLDGTLIEHTEFAVDRKSGRFEALFALDSTPAWGKPYVSTTSGVFGLCLMPVGELDVFEASRVLHFESRAQNGNNFRVLTPAGFADITDFGVSRSLLVYLRGPLEAKDSHNDTRLARVSLLQQDATERPLLPRVALCCSFSGTSVHDSPRPIAEAMLRDGLVDEIVWGVEDRTLDPGPGARVVPMHSAEFIELLHRAKYLINSAHFPHYFRKREDQIYVQTWHGTPLKKIHNDAPLTSLSNSYRDLMEREIVAWDLLLAQSPAAERLLVQAFNYTGPTLGQGYPRNDVLFDTARMKELRSSFRSDFGISDDAMLVLYAPTWRDNAINTIAANGFEQLDVSALLDSLGPNARLLLRGHSNTRRFGRQVLDDRVLDVSGFSGLDQLFAASDLLITDYSSLFFDYALTGKPIFGFAADLKTYSTSLRGMYFDYAEVFPGPIAQANEELLDIIGNRDAFSYRKSDILNSILESEKGDASRRVVEWLVAERETNTAHE